MGKAIDNFKKYFKQYLITFIVSMIIGAGLFLSLFFVYGQKLLGALNGTGITFAVLIGAGTMVWVTRAGMFDSMSYGFNQMFSSMFSKNPNKYNDFVKYKEDRETKRRNSPNLYLSILLSGLLFAIAFVILEIVKINLVGY